MKNIDTTRVDYPDKAEIDFVHLHKNRALYIMTIQVKITKGWWRPKEEFFLENYVSCHGEAWQRMPGKERASQRLAARLRKIFLEAKEWALVEDLHRESRDGR